MSDEQTRNRVTKLESDVSNIKDTIRKIENNNALRDVRIEKIQTNELHEVEERLKNLEGRSKESGMSTGDWIKVITAIIAATIGAIAAAGGLVV